MKVFFTEGKKRAVLSVAQHLVFIVIDIDMAMLRPYTYFSCRNRLSYNERNAIIVLPDSLGETQRTLSVLKEP